MNSFRSNSLSLKFDFELALASLTTYLLLPRSTRNTVKIDFGRTDEVVVLNSVGSTTSSYSNMSCQDKIKFL